VLGAAADREAASPGRLVGRGERPVLGELRRLREPAVKVRRPRACLERCGASLGGAFYVGQRVGIVPAPGANTRSR
jgi:hypothetical protein